MFKIERQRKRPRQKFKAGRNKFEFIQAQSANDRAFTFRRGSAARPLLPRIGQPPPLLVNYGPIGARGPSGVVCPIVQNINNPYCLLAAALLHPDPRVFDYLLAKPLGLKAWVARTLDWAIETSNIKVLRAAASRGIFPGVHSLHYTMITSRNHIPNLDLFIQVGISSSNINYMCPPDYHYCFITNICANSQKNFGRSVADLCSESPEHSMLLALIAEFHELQSLRAIKILQRWLNHAWARPEGPGYFAAMNHFKNLLK